GGLEPPGAFVRGTAGGTRTGATTYDRAVGRAAATGRVGVRRSSTRIASEKRSMERAVAIWSRRRTQWPRRYAAQMAMITKKIRLLGSTVSHGRWRGSACAAGEPVCRDTGVTSGVWCGAMDVGNGRR